MTLETDMVFLDSGAYNCSIRLPYVADNLDMREPSNYNKMQHDGIGFIAVANRTVILELIEAMEFFVYSLNNPLDYWKWYKVHFGLYNRAEPLTMQNIIETMWNANPLETFYFINYIDGMRASIWNISIFEEHLENIYTHFLSWP